MTQELTYAYPEATHYDRDGMNKYDRIRMKKSVFKNWTDRQIQLAMRTVYENATLTGVSNHSDDPRKEEPRVYWATINGREFGVTVSEYHKRFGQLKFLSVYEIWDSKRQWMLEAYGMESVK